ncbi:MAG: GNAT family N-acetyltransferase [Pseudomonadota bacterium]|nr:GNAT family N-acetyltransferase [Pseudomonadota bacterium]
MTSIADPISPASADDLPLLRSSRLGLRGFRDNDLDAFFAVHGDPAVNRYWSFPAWTEASQGRAYLDTAIAARSADCMLCWAITEGIGEAAPLIGAVTLASIQRDQGRAEIGYALRASHWGRGHAREAVELVLGHAFDGLGLRRVEADIDPRNLGSCRLVERLGFVREGLLRERWQVAGELCDSAIYGLLASDWRARTSRAGTLPL